MNPQLQGFKPVSELMGRIMASGAQYPRVRLAYGEQPLVLTVAGAKARFPGCINLTDGGRYPAARFFGRITPEGEFKPAPAARNMPEAHKRALWELLRRMRAGEAEEVFAEHGKRFGVCAICGRELTNAESVEHGIGPVCRARAFH